MVMNLFLNVIIILLVLLVRGKDLVCVAKK